VIEESRRLIAFTFDDGPSEWTPAILDVMKEHDARATFFVIGDAIAGRRETLRRAGAEGHEIGNHTWSHPHLTQCSEAEVREQLEQTASAVESVTGRRPVLFRPPYFDFDSRVERVVRQLGFGPALLATCTPGDWDPLTADEIVARTQIHHRAVVCLHDGRPRDSTSAPSRQPTVDAVGAIVPALIEQGYELVTASELLGS
jgi:peptidoglycan/xylan/chitin deacetylase (PgdA/CDA1 family)